MTFVRPSGRVNLKDGRKGDFVVMDGSSPRMKILRRVVVRRIETDEKPGKPIPLHYREVSEIIYDLDGGGSLVLSMAGRDRVVQPIMFQPITPKDGGPRVEFRNLRVGNSLTCRGVTYTRRDDLQKGIALIAGAKSVIQWYTYVGTYNAVLRVVKIGNVTSVYVGAAFPNSTFELEGSRTPFFQIFRRK